MKATKLLLAASLAAASLGAMANDQEGSPKPEQFNGTLSRAEVQSQLSAYKQAGVNPWSTSYNQLGQFNSGRSRADVRAEFLASRDQVAAMGSEDSGSAYLTQLAARRVDAGTNLAGQPVNSAK
jgi:opacity protein-like surface antigen